MIFLFYLFSGLAIGGAIGVVMAKSPVGSLLFMVTTLAAMAATFVLLEAHFLAAIQIIVYAGAIMVLFLFVIMLLNLGHDYQKDLKGGAFAVFSFGIIGGIVGILVIRFGGAGVMVGFGGGVIDVAIVEYGTINTITKTLYTTYIIPFEITGILLLVAIVGALVLAKRDV